MSALGQTQDLNKPVSTLGLLPTADMSGVTGKIGRRFACGLQSPSVCRNEKAAGNMGQRPSGLKIDLR